MMDKTVPYVDLAMKLDSLRNLPEFELPERYGWRFFRPGDIAEWAGIEISAGEFETPEQAAAGFRRYFPTDDALYERMLFLTDGGVPFATAAAWYDDDGGPDGPLGRLHWVGIERSHQRRGLSYPLVSLTMRRMRELGHAAAFLTTQTTSWPAIKVYRKFGFRPMIREAEEMDGWRIVSEKTGMDFLKNE